MTLQWSESVERAPFTHWQSRQHSKLCSYQLLPSLRWERDMNVDVFPSFCTRTKNYDMFSKPARKGYKSGSRGSQAMKCARDSLRLTASMLHIITAFVSFTNTFNDELLSNRLEYETCTWLPLFWPLRISWARLSVYDMEQPDGQRLPIASDKLQGNGEIGYNFAMEPKQYGWSIGKVRLFNNFDGSGRWN